MASRKETRAEDYGTDADVEAAIRALSDADSLRLRRVAEFRVRALAGLGLGIDGDDLLQEALARTLDGKRQWRKSISFVRHLMETMRSIASHARDSMKACNAILDASEDAASTADGLPLKSHMGDGERIAAANEQLAKICQVFKDDDEVGLVMQGLANEMKGPEIQQDLGLNETQYETIMTRLRRGVDRKNGWRP
ncbi:MAG: hypothetical protein ACOY0T_27115 [Myxococcota bacterium]